MNRVHAQRLVAAPVQQHDNASSPRFDAELEALEELGVHAFAVGTPHEYLLAEGRRGTGQSERMAIAALVALRKEALLARLVVDRFRKQNIVSWSGSELPQKDKGYVTINGQIFTAGGFSFLAPLIRRRSSDHKPKPSLVLIDTFAGVCSLADVQSFIARADAATCRGQSRQPYLGILGAPDFDEKAWKEARARGLLTINFRQMFGDEALNAMAVVERILGGLQATGSTGAMAGELLQFSEALEGLKANPIVSDLCAIGFELLAGLVLRSDGYEGVTLGQDVPFRQERTRDVDVLGHRDAEVAMIECKAYHASKELSSGEVRKFFTETVPACRAWWTKKEGRPPRRCTAEIWTSGQVGTSAQQTLKELRLGRDVDARLCSSGDVADRLPSRLRTRGLGLLDALGKGGQTWSDLS